MFCKYLASYLIVNILRKAEKQKQERRQALVSQPDGVQITIFFTHPALVVVLAFFCLGEAINWLGLIGIAASLLGVVIISQPPFLTGGAKWSLEHVVGRLGNPVPLCATEFLGGLAPYRVHNDFMLQMPDTMIPLILSQASRMTGVA